jgi:predicted acyl esterase
MPRRVSSLVVLVGAAAVAAFPSAAAGPEAADSVRARYTKFEYRIAMRDGVKLFTSVFVPKDAGGSKRYPILLNRTPYSLAPYGATPSRQRGPSKRRRGKGSSSCTRTCGVVSCPRASSWT